MIEKARNRRLGVVFSLAALVILAITSYWYFFLRAVVDSNDAYVEGNIVPITALTPGIVAKLGVDNSMFVHANQWLLSEEQDLTSTHLDKASAALAEAVRQTQSQFAVAAQEEAAIATLRAQRTKLHQDLARYIKAETGGGVSSQKVSDTRADIDIIGSQIVAAQAALRKAQAMVAGTTVYDNPLVRKETANFVEAYIRNERTRLYAPVSGYIANRRVEVGEQVKEGQWLMAIVPLSDLWVTANIKETSLTQVRAGQPVQIRAHVYGREVNYHGQVLGIVPAGGSTFSLFPPDNSTGNYIHIVERVPVRISLPGDELEAHPLRPGMSVSVSIDTQDYGRYKGLASNVQATGPNFETRIYAQELQTARTAAQVIIDENVRAPIAAR